MWVTWTPGRGGAIRCGGSQWRTENSAGVQRSRFPGMILKSKEHTLEIPAMPSSVYCMCILKIYLADHFNALLNWS